MKSYDVIIVGGGLAGLTAAIHLSKVKHTVLVLEKNTYPHHKVCGEYVSNEILPYLEYLGIKFGKNEFIPIDYLKISASDGEFITSKLPLGGFGISRYAFDNKLYSKAIANGVKFIFQRVTNIEFVKDSFKIELENTKTYRSKIAIGAYGKRSRLDKSLDRSFIHKKSSWLAVKMHYNYNNFPNNEVALHNFKGGYGGLSKTETGAVNFCYLASYKSFQKQKNINNFNERVVAKNPFLNTFLEKATPIFDEPLSIAQISFEQKKSIENHMLMCGDTAGLIHPLCGNGMAMAIHSAKIASELIHRFLKDNIDRQQLEANYTKQWNQAFRHRLWVGRQLQSLLLNEKLSDMALKAVTTSPTLLRRLIKSTHGKPIQC